MASDRKPYSFFTVRLWLLPLAGVRRFIGAGRPRRRTSLLLAGALLLTLLCHMETVLAQSGNTQKPGPGQGVSGGISVLPPPGADGPVPVRAAFCLRSINEIDDKTETFQFTGLLRLTWHDQRQAFDPEKEGIKEKVYQGNYQFNELSPAWYPEVALANVSGMYEQHGIVLRVQADGTSTLTTMVDAIAEVDLNMRRYPFDTHTIKAVFEIVGFNNNEVRFVVEPVSTRQAWKNVKLSQWHIKGVESATGQSLTPSAETQAASSTFIVTVEAKRRSVFVVRLVMMPLALIVMLSWSVFWMERSSLGDRINISFIGILTAVAYQIVIGDLLPHMSYFTLMNGFLNISFLIMGATVLVNIMVGAYDKQGRSDIGDRIDFRCRWIFPLAYAGLLALAAVIAFILL